ncbi:MAG TPA: M23 family metallopeptidase [Gemmatimonadales bacterium]|jgi:murein DD-endopeptidase MepM/ murein hydrolase activator NlpD|nr:M23 family metallopeptidase [Gemmatimonadales bacterium]
MKKRRRGRAVTIVIQRDGTTKTRSFRIPIWALRLGAWTGAVALVIVLLVIALYGPLLRAAARVPGMDRELARLRAENTRVRELSAALDSAESRYAQVRQMMGGEIVRDPVAMSSSLPVAPPIRARLASTVDQTTGVSLPGHWPLDEPGYITRGQVKAGGRDEAHPGIDIAVPVGNLVRASGGATVRQAGEDPEYGFFVLLEHPDEYQTMYGHLSRILVTPGATVSAGEVIGLSGNSGRSTAPHLHFEIRLRGLSLDPLTMVKEGR